jgi:hypothetical protein
VGREVSPREVGCTCFLGHPPCGYCESSSECEMCGEIFFDRERTAICERCGASELRLAVFLARRESERIKGG